MLAISACVSPPSTASGYDARKLFRMAESALRRSGAENRIDVVQALILLSLTQTGCGDKGAAFIYASRAVGMILNMGLNLARKYDQTSVRSEISILETLMRTALTLPGRRADPIQGVLELLRVGQIVIRRDWPVLSFAI